jgi:hypothetical protein
MKLLTVQNAKTSKGESLGYLTGILYLAPSKESGRNVCPFASAGCIKGCLDDAGRAMVFPEMIHGARIRKTQWYTRDKAGFMVQLRKDVHALVRRAAKLHMIPAVRINGTSDLAELSAAICAEFPHVQFYDYTKIPRPQLRVRPNYHITFSLHESNRAHAIDALNHGVNVAVVFNTKRGAPLPETFLGARVIDGDLHDLRFLDGYKGSVIGLRAKGPAKKDASGFVQIAGTSLALIA